MPMMPARYYIYLATFFVLLIGPVWLSAQPLDVINAPPITPENLITNVFLGDGVDVIDVQFDGDVRAVGFFNHGEDEIGMERGIVMTTGRAVTQGADQGVNSPGDEQASEGTTNLIGDPDMQAIAGAGTGINDVTRYTITFVPTSDTLRFTYAFGSEEYPEYACSNFNDIFGFFISGPGINGGFVNNAENIALIPGTNLPVRINNVNPGVVGANGTIGNCTPPNGTLAYSQFYNDNNNSPNLPVYDGFTDVFVAQAVVMPCSTYTIKLVICDVGDSAFDSGVFLEAKSFGTGSLDVEIVGLAIDGGVAEGCTQGDIVFSLPNPVEDDFLVEFSVDGTATPDVDYPALPDSVWIPAGDSLVTIPLSAFEDNLVEGDETILLSVQRDPCNRDTFTIVIKDNRLEPPGLGPDLSICAVDSVQLSGDVPVPLPDPPTFVSTAPLAIESHNIPYISEIDVFGVLPTALGPEAIMMICIDSLDHRWIDDLDIFLVSPGGQFLELTTDNGGNGGNGLGVDHYLRTCFTLDATTPINFPGPLAPPTAVPFTGDWLPEGVWSDLWDGGDKPTNGTWQLVVTDDTQSLGGTLYSWRIVFNPVYQVDYSWSPTAGLSCTDCPDPWASPDTTTTYVLTATDSYGCTATDTITIEAIPGVEMTEVVCSQVTNNSVEVIWSDATGATGYEVSVNGGDWETPSGPLAHTVTGLGFLEAVTISVRALAACPGDPVSVTCTTLDCTPPNLQANPTAVNCFAGSDGAVSIVVNAGTGPFTFDLNGDSNDTGNFTGLSAGNYTANVTDALGCTGTVGFTIAQPADPGFNLLTLQEVSCFGATDGSLTVEVTAGNGPYTFDWGGISMDSVATNLPPGNAQLILTDANGCSSTLDYSLAEPTELSAATTPFAVDCNGNAGGSALVTPAGGAAPYTFQWDDPLGQTTDSVSMLLAGNYQVIVTDANGCTAAATVEITEPPALTALAAAEDTDCFGEANGALSVAVDGGTPNTTVTWVNVGSGEIVGNSVDLADLPAGDYLVEVTDANGCMATDQVTINQPDSLEIADLSLTDPSCQGLADGVASVAISGGVSPYEISWDGAVGSDNITTLAGGDHQVSVLDANGCMATMSFTLTAPAAVSLEIVPDSVSCFAGMDGSAAVIPSGGTPPYTYLWSNGQADSIATNFAAGTITVEVTDANGCQASQMAEVLQPAALELSLDPTDPSCNGGTDGTILADPAGGVMPYSYAWGDGQNGQQAGNLSQGAYTLVVTDANGCTATASASLGEPAALAATTSAEEQSCLGPPDGQAGISVTGGTGPYTYLWDDGQTTATATNLTTGAIGVTVTDAQGCTYAATVDVPQAEAVAIVGTEQTNVSCFEGSDGALSVSVAGGETPYTFTWSVASVPNTGAPTGLPAGVYDLTVTDANGCFATTSLTLTEPDLLVLSTNVTNVVCAGEQTGALDLVVAGGTPPFNYDWSTGSDLEDVDQLAAGEYLVIVTDAQGCTAQLRSTVDEAPPLALEATVEKVDCQGRGTGAIKTSLTGGQPPYQFNWSNGASSNSLLDVTAGEYELNITDAYGCSLRQSFTVEEPQALEATFETDSVSCYGGNDGRIHVLVEGGTPSYRYQLDNGPMGGSSVFVGLEADDYRVTVQDANGCIYPPTMVSVAEPGPIELDLGADQTIRFGDSVSVVPAISAPYPIVRYEWEPADSTWLSCFDCMEVVVFPEYQVDLFLTVIDENGCTEEDAVRFLVRKDFPVQVPTGFTPNNDNNNDLLRVHGLPGIRVLWFRVFDRWGEELFLLSDFEVNAEDQGWDGTFRGRPVNSGVYLWQVEVLLPDGSTKTYQGQTTLIR